MYVFEFQCGAGTSIDSQVAWKVKDHRYRATVDILSDKVFLDIFNFCLHDPDPTKNPLELTKKWQTLVHVCQRWRRIILSSLRRLDLHLSCSYGTPVRKNLAFWPVGLPLTVDYPGRLHPDYGSNLPLMMKTTSLLHSSTPAVYIVSIFMQQSHC